MRLRHDLQQLGIGCGAPEEERQTRREIRVGDAIALPGTNGRRRLFEAEHEARAGENRLQRESNAALEIAAFARPSR